MKQNLKYKRTLRRANRRGASLVEVLAGALLIGILLVPSLRMVGSVARNYSGLAERSQGKILADSLLAEMMTAHFADPDTALRTFGIEADESSANRIDFDDIDDYHGLDEQPPRDRDGQTISGSNGFRRQVVVEYVQISDPAVVSSTPTSLLRLRVIVSHPRYADFVAETVKYDLNIDQGLEKNSLDSVEMEIRFSGQAHSTNLVVPIKNDLVN